MNRSLPSNMTSPQSVKMFSYKLERKKVWPHHLSFHRLEDRSRTSKLKLLHRLLPNTFYHHLTIERVQESRESRNEISKFGLANLGKRNNNSRMDLPTHQKTTMTLLSLVNRRIDKTTRSNLRRPSRTNSKSLHPHLQHRIRNRSSQLCALAPSRIGQVNNHVVG